MTQLSNIEKFFVFIGISILGLLTMYVMISPLIVPSEKDTCEPATVVDKRFTGESNNIATVFARTDEGEIVDVVDEQSFYAVEIGDAVIYCVYVDALTKTFRFDTVERIEQ